MATRSLADVLSGLNTPVPQTRIKDKPGAGNEKFAYLEGDYVYHRLDELFGANNWSITEANVAVTIPPYPCAKRVKFNSGSYHPRTNEKFPKDTWMELQGFGFAVSSAVKIEVRFPDGSIVKRANTGIAAGWFEDFGSKQDGEFRRVFGAATTLGLKRCFETLGVTLGRGMNKEGIVPEGYLMDDDTIQGLAESYEHLGHSAATQHVTQVSSGRTVATPVQVPTAQPAEPARSNPRPSSDLDGGIDMDLRIGGANAAAPATKSAGPGQQKAAERLNRCEALMLKPEAFDSVESWKVSFRGLRDILNEMETPDEIRLLQAAYDNWQKSAEDYGIFKDARLKEPLGNCYSSFDNMLRDRHAILSAGAKAA